MQNPSWDITTIVHQSFPHKEQKTWQVLGRGDSPLCDSTRALLACRPPHWEVLSDCSSHSTDEARDSRHHYSQSGRQMCISASLTGHWHHSSGPVSRAEMQNSLHAACYSHQCSNWDFTEKEDMENVPYFTFPRIPQMRAEGIDNLHFKTYKILHHLLLH